MDLIHYKDLKQVFFLSQHPEYDVKSPGISFEIITASLLAEIFCESELATNCKLSSREGKGRN